MKTRVFSILIVIALLLSGCSSASEANKEQAKDKWSPELASTEIRPYAEQAISIIDKYLNFEISKEEIVDSLKELNRRIGVFDISTKNAGDYNKADEAIDYCITMSSIGLCTDAEYYKYRDILAFQIGEKTSGILHKPDQRIVASDEAEFKRFVDFSKIPFDFGIVQESNGCLSISLFFDRKDCVFAFELSDFIKDIYQKIKDNNIENANINVYYDCYRQSICGISFKVENGNISGQAYRLDAERARVYKEFQSKYSEEERANMEKYPDEFDILNPLYEFDSLDGISEAADIASEFAGNK